MSCQQWKLYMVPCLSLQQNSMCHLPPSEAWMCPVNASAPVYTWHINHAGASLSVQVFRTDFITAMKLPDSAQLGPDDFYVLSDPWRQEWEKGVQVPASLEAIPEPVVR